MGGMSLALVTGLLQLLRKLYAISRFSLWSHSHPPIFIARMEVPNFNVVDAVISSVALK